MFANIENHHEINNNNIITQIYDDGLFESEKKIILENALCGVVGILVVVKNC